ncbi:MAG: hypothetical protein IKL37_03810 [Alphaproteobacteria bacterium]|nr:hypothetical protein [Alphaproteobacteria bacterium]
MMINPADISVVVQGTNVKKQTNKCLRSIRKYLPGATIIFSTYENTNVADLDYDVLVRSPDPGAEKMTPKWSNNTNRILVTSNAGLAYVKTKYVIRMRSDMIFANSKILNDIASQFPKRDKKYSVFKKRVLFYALFSRYQETVHTSLILERPFDISDWFCFGLTTDVKDYFNCPLTDEPGFTYYFHGKNIFANIVGCASWQYPVEQWICMNFFSKYFPAAKMQDSFDYDENRIDLSRKLLANNMVIVDYKNIGVYIQKKSYKHLSKIIHKKNLFGKYGKYGELSSWIHGVYTHQVFLSDYQKYCDSTFQLATDNKQILILEHFYKHVYFFVRPFMNLLNIRVWLGDFISIFWYAGKYLIYSFTKTKNDAK